MRKIWCFARAAALVASPAANLLGAQQLSSRELTSPRWATAYEFTAVTSLVALRNGDHVIADPGSKRAFLVRRAGAQVLPLGAAGEGPGEYRVPQAVLHGPRGMTVLVDPQLRRFSFFDQNVQFVRSTAFPEGAGGLTGRVSGSEGSAIYYLDIPRDPGNRQLTLRRLLLESGRHDSVSTLLGHQLGAVSSDATQARRTGRMSFYVVPHSVYDGFAAIPGVGVAVVRGTEGMVEVFRVGERQAKRLALPLPHFERVSDSARLAVRPRSLRPLVPSKRSAFDVDQIVADSTHGIWIPRNARQGGGSEWLVIDLWGRARRVWTRHDARLVALLPGTAILAERDDDDLERLAAYAIPAEGGVRPSR